MSGVASQTASLEGAPAGRARATGPVALVGSGEFLDVMVDVDRGLLAGRPDRAVFLPTAAAEEGEVSVNYWVELGKRHFERLGVEPVPLLVLDRQDADSPELAAQVEGAGLVYLSGGNPGYLADTLRDTLVWSAILDAWQMGTALAGCSAGACALSTVSDYVGSRARPSRPRGSAADEALPETFRAGDSGGGLGVVPRLAVIPHYDRILEWVPDLKDRYIERAGPGVTIVGIDEDTALASPSGDGLGFEVAGRQSVFVLHRDGTTTKYESGSTFSVA
jgi:cyanophycinase